MSKKTNFRLLIYLAIPFLLIEFEIRSQPPSLTLYSITESNGLSDNRVTCVLQDSQGFMWIGTEDGLNRYDGSIFKIYQRKKNDSREIADNFIHSLAEDNQHHIWVGTNNGLSEINPETNELKTYEELKAYNVRVIMKVLPDREGNLWLGTLGGLLEFVPDQKKVLKYLVPQGLLSDNRITDLHIDRRGRLWVATFQDLWEFDRLTKRFTRPLYEIFKSKSNGLINRLAEDHTGKIWLGYWSSGVKWIDPDNQTSGSFTSPLLPAGLSGIAEVRNKNNQYEIWLGNFLKIDEKNEVTEFTTNAASSFGNYQVADLYRSRDNLLWALTNRGILIMDPAKQFFRHKSLSLGEISHQGIVSHENGQLIYLGGTGNNFLKVYDSSFSLKKSYTFSQKSKFNIHGNPALLSIVREDQDHLWLGTEEGLVLLDERSGAQELFRITEQESKVATRNFIDNIFIDSHKIHWVFTWRAGIWQFDLTARKFKKIIDGITRINDKKEFLIADAVEDDNNNIWFADLDEGLIFFNRKTNTFSKPPGEFFQSWFNLAQLIYEKPYVWGVTHGKVFRINDQTFISETWIIPEDLNKSVSSFCSDLQNHLWIGTRRGLISFDKVSYEFKQFTSNDGLMDNVMDGTLSCLKNGKVIYLDDNYATQFDPSELVKSSEIPGIIITDVLSQNQPIAIRKDINGKKSVDLDYTYNNFVFKWAVLHFSNPLQNKYYCKLDGVDKEWKYVGNTGSVQYASLSSGTYIFRAKGATSDGVMNNDGDYVLITIHPPFWKTWWFYSLGVMSFIGLTYTWYRYRLNEELKTERLRNKISTDLHDEIGSTLSSISIMSDLVVQKSTEEKTLKVANEIKENAIVLMERMDDIVWSINPKNDSLENLLLRVRRFAAHLFEAKKIDYEINISTAIEKINLPMEVRQNIYLILKEGINNLVKHAECTRATIEVTQLHSRLNIHIIDNGRGFFVDEPKNGNGLISMKNRAVAMKMDFTISSEVGKGTSINLTIKIK